MPNLIEFHSRDVPTETQSSLCLKFTQFVPRNQETRTCVGLEAFMMATLKIAVRCNVAPCSLECTDISGESLRLSSE
jgi:hypothetical protein